MLFLFHVRCAATSPGLGLPTSEYLLWFQFQFLKCYYSVLCSQHVKAHERGKSTNKKHKMVKGRGKGKSTTCERDDDEKEYINELYYNIDGATWTPCTVSINVRIMQSVPTNNVSSSKNKYRLLIIPNRLVATPKKMKQRRKSRQQMRTLMSKWQRTSSSIWG